MQKTSLSSALLMLLTFFFVVCKATGYTAIATWSWFWVLSPVLIPILIIFAILIVMGLVVVLAVFNK